MFRGNHPTRVDEKGRLKLPAEFKRLVDELYGTQFYITSKDGRRAEIYPLSEWQKIEEKVAQIPSMNPARKKFLDRVNYYGQMAEMDAQGRVLLPQILRETAKLAGDAVVFGQQTYLEVANHDEFKQSMETDPLTAEDQQALASFGLWPVSRIVKPNETPQGEHMVPGSERHVPVLLQDAIRYLNVRAGGTYVDATLGLGGHAAAVARELGGQGQFIGFDRDPDALELARARFQALSEELGEGMPQWELHGEPFSVMSRFIAEGSLDGVLADFGVSSMQLDSAHRGFSFQADGPLDMRMDPRRGATAEQVVNQADEKVLADLIYEFGEERRSRRFARAIVRARPIKTTAQLAKVLSTAAPAMKSERGRHQIHPATRIFQALRIYVNAELDEIKALLRAAPRLLKPGGRLVVISFHSLEDRLAKDALREAARQGIFEVLTRKPVTANEEETDRNPRARSAKLRAAERTGKQMEQST